MTSSDRVWAAGVSRLGYRLLVLGAIGLLLVLVLTSMPYQWSWRSVWSARLLLLRGLWMTVKLSLGGMVLGLLLGTGGCLLRLSRFDPVRFLGVCYVELIRNTPLLVQLYIAYFGLFSALRINDEVVIGAVCLGVFAGAYITEILRAGVESVDSGQTEAALSLGLTPWQTLCHVVGPQAFRRVIPPLTGQFVSLVKDSSLLSTIAIAELTKVARSSAATDYRYFEFYLAIAALYMAVTFPLSRMSLWLERRLAVEGRT